MSLSLLHDKLLVIFDEIVQNLKIIFWILVLQLLVRNFHKKLKCSTRFDVVRYLAILVNNLMHKHLFNKTFITWLKFPHFYMYLASSHSLPKPSSQLLETYQFPPTSLSSTKPQLRPHHLSIQLPLVQQHLALLHLQFYHEFHTLHHIFMQMLLAPHHCNPPKLLTHLLPKPFSPLCYSNI